MSEVPGTVSLGGSLSVVAENVWGCAVSTAADLLWPREGRSIISADSCVAQAGPEDSLLSLWEYSALPRESVLVSEILSTRLSGGNMCTRWNLYFPMMYELFELNPHCVTKVVHRLCRQVCGWATLLFISLWGLFVVAPGFLQAPFHLWRKTPPLEIGEKIPEFFPSRNEGKSPHLSSSDFPEIRALSRWRRGPSWPFGSSEGPDC